MKNVENTVGVTHREITNQSWRLLILTIATPRLI